jgi:phage repressor protein C with HTH and peptisase S24 domain
VPDFKEIIVRVKDILSSEVGDRKVFDKDVAKALGMNHLTFATMKSRNRIPYQELLDFCAKRKISINWLFYNQVIDSLVNETEKFAKIRYFQDIYASAGGGAQNYEANSEYLYIDNEVLERTGVTCNPDAIEAINVLGDSMEPTLHEGNVVLVDRTQQRWQRGGIFVVATIGGLFIKRLQPKADGAVELISDNPAYPPERIESSDVKILGKVVGAFSKIS